MIRCKEVMRHAVQRVREDETVRAAADRMREYDVGFLPVCDAEGHLVGVVTDRDLVLRVLAVDGRTSETLVRDVMTTHPISCRPEDPLREAERLMEQHRKSRVAVADASGQVLGVLSLTDITPFERPARLARTLYAVATRRFSPERP